MRRTTELLGMLMAMVVAGLFVLPATANAEEWEWSVTPYLFMSQVSADVSVNDREFLDETVDLSELVDRLDFVFQINLQGQRGRHGFLLDFTYYDFDDDDKRYPLRGPGGSDIVATSDFELILFDAAGIYNPRGHGEGFSLIYGLRILDADQSTDIRIQTPGGEETDYRRFEPSGTNYDALVGLRYMGRFAENWRYHIKADGSTGGTEYTWSGQAGLGYAFGQEDRYTLFAGYRYLQIELEEDFERAELKTKLALYGPYLGFKFGF